MILLKAYFSFIVKSSYQKILFVVNLCTEYFFPSRRICCMGFMNSFHSFCSTCSNSLQTASKVDLGGASIYIYIYMYIYIYAYIYIFIYTYIYVCISTSTTDPRWLEHTLGAPSPRFYSLDNGLASRDALPHRPRPWVPWVP